jgi:hypothetical protein
MKTTLMKTTAALAVLALLIAIPAAAPAQDKPDDPAKVLKEIVGEYSFSYQGQTLVVIFSEENGKLMGAPPGETPEEIKPMAGKPLCFDITVSTSGQYYELRFVRNDQGVIDKCLMTTMGIEVEGVKVVE